MNELMNWDPFRELDTVHDRMNRLFNRGFSGQLFSAPSTDIYEEDGKLVIETALPNFTGDEVDAQINQNRLEIKAEHKSENESNERNYLRRESTSQSYYRQFVLPQDVDVDDAIAKFENGVLRVSFNKKELPQPKKLQFTGGQPERS